MRILVVLAFCCWPGFAASQSLASWLERGAVADRAAVVCLWQNGGIKCAVSGRLSPVARPARETDRYAIASVGKTFTAVAVLQLVEQGRLRLDEMASNWLPGHLAKAFGGITIRQLLSMQSGLIDYYDDDYLDALMQNRSKQSLEFALEMVAQEPRAFRPGARFSYSNTNYVLLQAVLEHVTDQPLHRVFQQQIFTRAGMKKTFVFGSRALPNDFAHGFENYRGAGVEDVSFYYQGQGLGDGALISTAPDLIRFYRALFVERNLLSASSLQEMLKDPRGVAYGLGVEVERVQGIGPMLGHSGGDLGFVSDIRIALDTGAIAVALIADSEGDATLTLDVLQSLSK